MADGNTSFQAPIRFYTVSHVSDPVDSEFGPPAPEALIWLHGGSYAVMAILHFYRSEEWTTAENTVQQGGPLDGVVHTHHHIDQFTDIRETLRTHDNLAFTWSAPAKKATIWANWTRVGN